MGLTLSAPPGFSDLSDSILAAGSPALGIDLAKIYQNACFGMVRTEVFSGTYTNNQVVPLPVSPIDGYVYARDELLYFWTIANSVDASSGWISQKDCLFYAAWLVDQATGTVYSDEWYIKSATGETAAHSNDGILQVWTVAQRQLSNLVLAASPSYSAVSSSWIGLDKPLSQQLAQGLNDDAKFSVLNSEFFYLGEYYNGQTVTLPVSPADGYTYSAAECRFIHSWRWTGTGNVSPLVAPPTGFGQMGPLKASINSSGVVSCSVAMIDPSGNLNTFTSLGRVSAFAFCQRSGTPGSVSPTANQFAEISFDDFMPGSDLPFGNVQQIVNDIQEALLTPEFFGPTTHANGDTIALPTSPIDGYVYSRSELQYLWSWSDTTNQTGTHLRMPLFLGHIDSNTGVVTLHVWRLPPGGPYVDDDDALARISVIVVARRAAQAPAAVAAPSTSPQSDAGTVATDVAPFLLSVNGAPVASGDGANLSDSTPAAPTGMRNVKWQKDALTPTDVSGNVPNIGGIDARTTTSETIGLSSQGKLVTLNNAGAVAVSLDSSAGSSFFCALKNIGAGLATLTPTSGTIDGIASVTISTDLSVWLLFDGTNWFSVGVGSSSGGITTAEYILGAANGSLSHAIVWPSLGKHPDVPPGSPGTLDDEFDASTIDPKWSWLNQSTSLIFFSNGHAVLHDPTSHTPNDVSAIIQTAPSTPWEVSAKVRVVPGINNWGTGTWTVGIVLYDSVSGKLILFGMGTGTHVALVVSDYTNTTTFSSQPFNASLATAGTVQGAPFYLRVRDDGTNLTFSFSYDGIVWTQAFQQSRTTFLPSGPNSVGLAVNNQLSTGDLALVSDWFRRTL